MVFKLRLRFDHVYVLVTVQSRLILSLRGSSDIENSSLQIKKAWTVSKKLGLNCAEYKTNEVSSCKKSRCIMGNEAGWQKNPNGLDLLNTHCTKPRTSNANPSLQVCNPEALCWKITDNTTISSSDWCWHKLQSPSIVKGSHVRLTDRLESSDHLSVVMTLSKRWWGAVRPAEWDDREPVIITVAAFETWRKAHFTALQRKDSEGEQEY